MSLQGGAPNEWLRPHDPDPDRNVIGSHRGSSEALNVRNPKEGFHYFYVRRNPNQVQRFLGDGWELVTSEDQEAWGIDVGDMPESVQSELDGLRAFKDVVLMRIPEENYRVIAERKRQLAEAARLQGGGEAFLERGREVAAQLGHDEESRPLYYKGADHRTYSREE